MRTLSLALVTFSAAFSQPRIDFDTTVAFPIALQDSIPIPSLQAFLYTQTIITTSCPGHYRGDFADGLDPDRVVKIPPLAAPLIQYTAPCLGPGQFDTTLTYHDRQYKVRTARGHVYMKVTGITKTFRVSLEFSSVPFPTSLPPRGLERDHTSLPVLTRKGSPTPQVRHPGIRGWHLLDGRTAIRD